MTTGTDPPRAVLTDGLDDGEHPREILVELGRRVGS
jgi:hypothetical protein